jgi:hypothetical protein
MNIKDIEVGEYYKLASNRKSRVGCAEDFFKKLHNKEVLVLNKLNNFNNKNTIHIQGLDQNGNSLSLVSFWCSPYDLKKKDC